MAENPFESPQSQSPLADSEPREVKVARPVYRYLAGVIGIWMAYSSLESAVSSYNTPYFGRFAWGSLSGLMGASWLFWIAVWGTFFPIAGRKR